MFAMISLLQDAAADAARAAGGLSTFSLLFMLTSMGLVTLLAAWSFFRIMRGKRHFDPDGTGPAHSPVTGEVDTR